MKSIYALALVGAALATASCVTDNHIIDILDYTNNFSYVYDINTGDDYICTTSHYYVKGDRETLTFTIEGEEIQLEEGGAVGDFSVKGLDQYWAHDSAYVYMEQLYPGNSGSLRITNLKFGQIGNTWLTFTANEHYQVNVIPKSYNLRSSKQVVTKIGNAYDTIYQENTLHTRYQVDFNPEAMTANITAYGPKFAPDVTGQAPMPLLEMVFPNLPVRFINDGYTIIAPSVIPEVKGVPYEAFAITDFRANIALTFEGIKELNYVVKDRGVVHTTLYSYNMN